MFQCDPKRYDLLGAIKSGSVGDWSMNQGRNRVSVGDRVWFRVTGKNAGIYAIGRWAMQRKYRPHVTTRS